MNNQALETAYTLIRRAKYITALTGAGISTPSGIPDFRSPTSGIWEHYNPAEVASLQGFRHDPSKFYAWIRPLAHTLLAAQPNPAHRALARMETVGKLKSVITQNIDMLHASAGSQQVYELHGSMREMTCIHCFEVFSAAPYLERFLEEKAHDQFTLPRCPVCDHILKPNIILFGEQLPATELIAARREAMQCDLMIVAGSSLEVYPAAELPAIARRNHAALIIIDVRPTAMDWLANVVLRGDVVDFLPQLANALENET